MWPTHSHPEMKGLRPRGRVPSIQLKGTWATRRRRRTHTGLRAMETSAKPLPGLLTSVQSQGQGDPAGTPTPGSPGSPHRLVPQTHTYTHMLHKDT